MWYRKNLYPEHNESMDRFIEKFNSCGVHTNLLMLRLPEDKAKHDGVFIDLETQKSFGFDWSKFDSYIVKNGELIYDKLLIVNSKINIQSSKIYIETDLAENEIIIAWREDLLQEELIYFYDEIKPHKYLRRTGRLTDKYKIYDNSNICEFKNMIKSALTNNTLNYTNFKEEIKL